MPEKAFQPATDFDAAILALTAKPLVEGDERYVPLNTARSDVAVRTIERQLRAVAREGGPPLALAFTGHRGSGKSTELYMMAHRLSEHFVPVVVDIVDESEIAEDMDFPDVLLFMARGVERMLREQHNIQLDTGMLDEIGNWFDKVTHSEVRRLEKEGVIQTQVGAKMSFWVRVSALLTSQLRASNERRVEIRQELRRYATDFMKRINELLEAADKLVQQRLGGRNLLILVDNLDRLQGRGRDLVFLQHGEYLTKVACNVVYTFPIDLKYGINNIERTFNDNAHVMPMARVQDRDGELYTPGIVAFRKLVQARLSIRYLFADVNSAGTSEALDFLIRQSGGCLRDLMTLLKFAVSRADEKSKIDLRMAQSVARTLRDDMMRKLDNVDWPLLARCHIDKSVNELSHADRGKLLFDRLILEYNGEGIWHDVHPALRDADEFRRTYKALVQSNSRA